MTTCISTTNNYLSLFNLYLKEHQTYLSHIEPCKSNY